MGHMHADNISKRLISKLEKGPISAKEFVYDAIAKRVSVHCSEGKYNGWENDYMFYMAFYDCVGFHFGGSGWRRDEPPDVKPILKTKADRKAWGLWKSGDIWDVEDHEEQSEVLDSVRFRLTPRGRRRLKGGLMTHPGTITH